MASSTRKTHKPGDVIPGTSWRVVRVLDEGGHAIVYLCEHLVFEEPGGNRKRRAAVKVLHDMVYASTGELADKMREELAHRMRQEANVLAQLKHPHLVTVLEAGMTTDFPSRPYTVMEYLRGESLAHALRNTLSRRLPFSYALALVADVVKALEASHARGVVHRDIKPSNIFLSRADDVTVTKLIDFGVASLLNHPKRITTGFLGTPRYAPPEVLCGQRPSPASDFYSLGLVLYELVCGGGPFDDAYRAQTETIQNANAPALAEYNFWLLAHTKLAPPPANKYRPDVPAQLEGLLVELLEKEPKHRPQTAARLHRQIQAIAQTLGEHGELTAPDRNRTEPTPIDNRMITFSAPTPAPISTAKDDAAAAQDATPLDSRPMGNHATLRIGQQPASDLSAFLPSSDAPAPPSEPPAPAAQSGQTVRLPLGPNAAPCAVVAEAVPSEGNLRTITPRLLIAVPAATDTSSAFSQPPEPSFLGQPTVAGAVQQAAAQPCLSSLADTPSAPAPVPPPPPPPSAADKPTVAMAFPVDEVPSPPPPRPVAPSHPTAFGVVLPPEQRARQRRRWQLALAAAAAVFIAIAVWEARPAHFSQATPPPWLAQLPAATVMPGAPATSTATTATSQESATSPAPSAPAAPSGPAPSVPGQATDAPHAARRAPMPFPPAPPTHHPVPMPGGPVGVSPALPSAGF